MYKFITTLTKMIFLAAMLFTVTACDSKDGPLEKAGQSIDEAATDVGNKIEDACEDVKEGMNAEDTRC